MIFCGFLADIAFIFTKNEFLMTFWVPRSPMVPPKTTCVAFWGPLWLPWRRAKNHDFGLFGALSILMPKIELVLQNVVFRLKINKKHFFWPKTPFCTEGLSEKCSLSSLRLSLRKIEFWQFWAFFAVFLLKSRLNYTII